MRDDATPPSERSADAGARLLERALSLPFPLAERLVEGEHALEQHDDAVALACLASFERRHDDSPRKREVVTERARGWLDWLGERWSRRWGPPTRSDEAWKLLEMPVRRREATHVAQLCWNHSLVPFVAWSRGARWFGAGLYEPGDDTTIFLMAFVGLIGSDDGPPGPPSPGGEQ